MELSQLKQFVTAARAENITEAAKSLYISQPALSNSISRLEKELGFRLFDRRGNQVSLNKSGSIFLDYTERSIDLLNEGIHCLRDFNGAQSFQVEYSIPHGGLFSSMRCQYVIDNPDVTFHQRCCTTSEAQERLLAGTLDFAITFLPPTDSRIEWTPLTKTHLEVRMNLCHPLAEKERISLPELENQQFIANMSSRDLMQVLADCCLQYNFIPRIFFAGDEPAFQDTLLKTGKTVVLSPDLVWRIKPSDYNEEHWDSGQKVSRPIADERCECTVGVAKLRDSHMSQAAARYLEFLEDEIRRALREAPQGR